MDNLINRWLVEAADAGSGHVCYIKQFETAEPAQMYLEKMAGEGFNAQLYHERHVLLREPVASWGRPGEDTSPADR